MNAGAHATPARRSLAIVLLALLAPAAVLFAGLAYRAADERAADYLLWSDRELMRASHLPEDPQVAGAEMSGGGRTPGGFMYTWLRALLAVAPGPLPLYRLLIALDILTILGLALLAGRVAGPEAALMAGAFLATAWDPFVLCHAVAFNPNLAAPFGIAGWCCFVECLVRGDTLPLPGMTLALALAAQFHLSYLTLLVVALVIVLASCRPGARSVLLAVATFAIGYAPFLHHEFLHGWPVIREIATRQRGLVGHLAIAPGSGVPLRDWASMAGAGLSRAFLCVRPPGSQENAAASKLFPISVHLFLLAAALWRVTRARDDRRLHRGIAWAVLFPTFVIISKGVEGRYLLFVLPGVALMLGTAYADLLRAARRRSTTAAVIATLVLSVWLLDTAGWNLVAGGVVPSQAAVTLADWTELIRAARERVGLCDRDIHDGRVSLLYRVRAGEPWGTIGSLSRAIAYPVESLPGSRPPESTRPVGVVALLSLRGDPSVSASDLVTAASALCGSLPPPRLRLVTCTSRLAITEYDLQDGNAFKNITNRYVKTAEERALAQALGSTGAGIVPLPAVAGHARFALRFRPPPVVYDVLVDVAWSNGRASARIVSDHLRGFDGLTGFVIRGPAVELIPDVPGPAITLPVHPGIIGALDGATLSPWNGPAVPVAAGAYRVRFVAADVAFRHDLPGEGPLGRELSPRLEIRY